jgi:protein-S-isoprenylcysteine O-methyltransferase Ste14/poly(3-hydroxybutyrate) depolymerase
MPVDALLLRKGIVLGSALVYWVGVLVQTRRVRRRIGRSPNVKPRGPREKLLWLGWLLVIGGWLAQPFLIQDQRGIFFSLMTSLLHPLGLVLGIVLVVGGYAGTLWCYASLGDAWRLGVRKREKTTLVKHGPYRRVRHPIYLFQTLMIAGVVLLLPSLFMVLLLGLHLLCITVKAIDEEAYLLGVHGPEYQAYLARSGRFLPGRRFLLFQILVWILFLTPAFASAELFKVDLEEGERPVGKKDSVAYSLFVPVADPDLPSPPWPAVILLHGFTRNHDAHWKNANYMAQRGIVVLTPDDPNLSRGDFPNSQSYKSIVEDIRWLSERSATGGDSLEGLIDPDRIGLAGHSMGGSVVFEAAIKARSQHAPAAALCLLDAYPLNSTLQKARSLKILPFASLRSEPGVCNRDGKVTVLLDRLRFETEDVRIVGAGHCDAENPTNVACSVPCGDGSNEEQTEIYQRLMYLFFQDALDVPSVERNPETYEALLDALEAEGSVARQEIEE